MPLSNIHTDWVAYCPEPCVLTVSVVIETVIIQRVITVLIDCYPPTLAFAKAGAAPGTTGGVDPVFLEPLPRRGSCLSCTFATPTLQANAITRPQQWLKSTPRPQQWLLL